MRPIGQGQAARLREMLNAGLPYSSICAEVGCTKSTVSRYATQMGLAKSKRKRDWAEICAFYEADHSGRATRREFRVLAKTWQEAIKRGDIIRRPARAHVRTIQEVLAATSVRRTHLKDRLIRERILRHRKVAWSAAEPRVGPHKR